MDTVLTFTSNRFTPTPGELDEDHGEYINPGIYAKALADFLETGLSSKGYTVSFRCPEDWGHWIEIAHPGPFKLALGCANTGDAPGGVAEHRIFVVPDKPVIHRFFRKIPVQAEVEQLVTTLRRILEESDHIGNIRTETA